MDPQNTQREKFWTHEIPTNPRCHDGIKPTSPTMTRDTLIEHLLVLWTTVYWTIFCKRCTQYLKSFWARFYLTSVKHFDFLYDVATNDLSKLCTLSIFSITSDAPTSKNHVAKITRTCCQVVPRGKNLWSVLEPEPRFGVIINFLKFHLIVDIKLSTLLFWFFGLFSWCKVNL